MHTALENWLVVCVKDARGYTKGQPMNGRATHDAAAAKAAAMSDICPGSFVAMPDDDFYASIDDESVLDKYLPATKADTPPREN